MKEKVKNGSFGSLRDETVSTQDTRERQSRILDHRRVPVFRMGVKDLVETLSYQAVNGF